MPHDDQQDNPGADRQCQRLPVAAAQGLATEREGQQAAAAFMKKAFADAGLPVMPSTTHIVPLMVGDPVLCKRISDELLERFAIYVQPINYPTVPKGTERLRFTPSPNHTDAMMDDLVRAMDALWTHCNVARLPAVA